jgi:hypothetical protein
LDIYEITSVKDDIKTTVLILAKDREDAINLAKANNGGFSWWKGEFTVISCELAK